MKIGIFGGCFNPVHNMHKRIATYLIENKYLDKVIFVPTSNLYNKQGLEYEDIRYEMLEILCKNNENLAVSSFEFGERKYTYQTLDYFKRKFVNSEIYFITGSDNIKEIHTWQKYRYILENYKIIVIQRNNDNISNLNTKNLIFVKLGNNKISSSEIRKIISKYGCKEKLYKYLDKDVINYILKNKLYLQNK